MLHIILYKVRGKSCVRFVDVSGHVFCMTRLWQKPWCHFLVALTCLLFFLSDWPELRHEAIQRNQRGVSIFLSTSKFFCHLWFCLLVCKLSQARRMQQNLSEWRFIVWTLNTGINVSLQCEVSLNSFKLGINLLLPWQLISSLWFCIFCRHLVVVAAVLLTWLHCRKFITCSYLKRICIHLILLENP